MEIKKKKGQYNSYTIDLSFGEMKALLDALEKDHSDALSDELYNGFRWYIDTDTLPLPGEDSEEEKKKDKDEVDLDNPEDEEDFSPEHVVHPAEIEGEPEHDEHDEHEADHEEEDALELPEPPTD